MNLYTVDRTRCNNLAYWNQKTCPKCQSTWAVPKKDYLMYQKYWICPCGHDLRIDCNNSTTINCSLSLNDLIEISVALDNTLEILVQEQVREAGKQKSISALDKRIERVKALIHYLNKINEYAEKARK